MVGRKIDRKALRTKGLLQLTQQSRQIRSRQVDLVHDDDAVEPALHRGLAHASGRDADAGSGIDHDRSRFHGRECTLRPTQQVKVSRGVDEIDTPALPLEMADSAVDRMLQLALEGIEIADRRATRELTWGTDRPSVIQQRLRERGLTGRNVSYQGEIANIGGRIRHLFTSPAQLAASKRLWLCISQPCSRAQSNRGVMDDSPRCNHDTDHHRLLRPVPALL